MDQTVQHHEQLIALLGYRHQCFNIGCAFLGRGIVDVIILVVIRIATIIIIVIVVVIVVVGSGLATSRGKRNKELALGIS